MTTRARVAVLRTEPETVLEDYQRLFELAGGPEALDPGATTILKDNITWHFPMPGANTTPGNWRASSWPCAAPGSTTWCVCKTRRL